MSSIRLFKLTIEKYMKVVCGRMLIMFCAQVKSFEKDRQSEKRILESDLVDHIMQKCRTKFFEERNIR